MRANELILMNCADDECRQIISSLCRARGAAASRGGVLTPKFLQ